MAIESQPDPMTAHAPRMFPRPTEAPEALASVRGSEDVMQLHRGWAQLSADTASATAPGAMRRRARALKQRLSGQPDRALLGDLIRAVDTLAQRCDELTNRLHDQQVITGELAESLGQEVTRLRAAVSRLPAAHDPELRG